MNRLTTEQLDELERCVNLSIQVKERLPSIDGMYRVPNDHLKSLIQSARELIEANQTIDSKSNLLCNIADTLRSRGFTEPSHLDERVIKMAQALDLSIRKLSVAIEAFKEVEGWCMPARAALKTIAEMK